MSEERLKTMEQKIDEITKAINNLALKVEGMTEKFFDKADERYASKETEKTVRNVQWLVVSTVVLAVIGLVIGDKLLR